MLSLGYRIQNSIINIKEVHILGQTIVEKILSVKSGRTCSAGELVVSDLDLMMGHDFNAAMTIQVFEELGARKVAYPEKTFFVFDHAVPAPNENYARIQQKVERFIKVQGVGFYPPGEGICHQLFPEKGHVKPGDVVIGTDSHTCTYGALNAFTTGIGSTDLAVALMSGKLWFKVPETIRVNFIGKLPKGVYSKDLILYAAKKLTVDGALYKCIEFGGPVIAALSLEERMTLTNMSVELGAKAGIMEADEKTITWLKERIDGDITPVFPDADAVYEAVYNFDVSELLPQIACPHAVDNVCDISDAAGTPVHSAFIGSCSNGRIADLRAAAKILEGKRVPKHIRLYIIPASREIWLKAIEEGLVSIFLNAGAILEPPCCGPCGGICGGIPADDENMISTATRNFKGRAGNSKSNVYLASPAVVAASALTGVITDPMEGRNTR